jgi:hypothetical protein
MGLRERAIEEYCESQAQTQRMQDQRQIEFIEDCRMVLDAVLELLPGEAMLTDASMNHAAFVIDDLDFIVSRSEGDLIVVLVEYDCGEVAESRIIRTLAQLGEFLSG